MSSSKFNLPTLNLSKFSDINSSSDDEVIHNVINNMHIKTDLRKSSDQIATSSELKYDNRLYKYKKELANRDIEFIMTETDLKKCHSDQSEVLYLQITLMPNIVKSTRTIAIHRKST